MSKRSWVWAYYNESNEGLVNCNLCSKQFKTSKSTTVLIRHLKSIHSLENTQDSSLTSGIPYTDNNARKLKLDKMLVDLIVLDLQPLTIVEDRGFRALLHSLEPRYAIPCRRTLQKFVEDAYIQKRRIVQEELDAVSNVCITCDTWTSINADNVVSVTGHFINQDFELKTYTLQTEKIRGNHTSYALSQTLRNVFAQWNLEGKIKCVVTDNAPNILAAARNINDSVCSVPCFAHTLNLVVKKSLASIPEIVNIWQKCRRMATYFKSSCLAQDKLREMQNALNIPKRKLILEVDTRWNSTYEMFNRILEQKSAIISALAYIDVVVDCLTNNEWETLAETIVILQPFFLLTTEWSTESNISISKVIVTVKQLHSRLQLNTDNILFIALKDQLLKSFNNIEQNSLYAMATILDPRFKVLGFMFNENAERAKTLIIDKISNKTLTEGTSFETRNTTVPNNQTSLWATFDNEVSQQNFNSTNNFGPTSELDNYISEPYGNRHSDPLQYWKTNMCKYPNLAKLATEILCCPATSVPCERIFSKAGNIITTKRNRLKDKTLNHILLLNN